MIVVRIALRDVKLLLHFDIFAGDTQRLMPIITVILIFPYFNKFFLTNILISRKCKVTNIIYKFFKHFFLAFIFKLFYFYFYYLFYF